MLQPVCFYCLVVEPGTVASLPFISTDHAELCHAPAGHMVAPFLELDHGRAIEAALPAFLLRSLNKYLGRRILRTLSSHVHFIVAYDAHTHPASLTFPHLPTVLDSDMVRFDPFAATTRRAVDAVASSIFLKLSVPGLFEPLIKQLVDMLERNVLRSAAFRWHVGRISDRHCEDASEAVMAHPMCAC
jgi:hypothetical protein